MYRFSIKVLGTKLVSGTRTKMNTDPICSQDDANEKTVFNSITGSTVKEPFKPL